MKASKGIRKKLASKSGASLSIALLVFIVCACVGSVVLTAATTTVSTASSAEEDTNRERYAVSSAADLIMSQMSGYETMTLTESWPVTYQESDYATDSSGNVTAGGRTLTKGAYVIGWGDSSFWKRTVQTGSDTVKNLDLSKYINDDIGTVVKLKDADNAGVLRDILAYGIYRHYWDAVSGYTSTQTSDPWDTLADTVPWNPSDTYSIATDSPMKISVYGFPDVYCKIEMDQDFTIYFDLYCEDTVNSKKVRTAEKWLTYAASANTVRKTTVDSASSKTEENFGGQGLNNTVVTNTETRSLTLNITFDNGALSADKPQEAGA